MAAIRLFAEPIIGILFITYGLGFSVESVQLWIPTVAIVFGGVVFSIRWLIKFSRIHQSFEDRLAVLERQQRVMIEKLELLISKRS